MRQVLPIPYRLAILLTAILGGFSLKSYAVSPDATSGFGPALNSGAGPPTGNPSLQNPGSRWSYWDQTNNKLYVHTGVGGSWVLAGGAGGGGGGTDNVIVKTSNFTVQASQTGSVFTTTGSVAQVTLTLPTWSSGLNYVFVSDAAQVLTVTAGGSDILRFGDAVTSAGGSFSTTSSGRGNSVKFSALSSGVWIATSATGTTWN